MADTLVAYQEVRINVRDPEVTHVHVFIENLSRDGLPVEGWRHRAFPARMSMLDILNAWAEGKEDPIMWDRGAP